MGIKKDNRFGEKPPVLHKVPSTVNILNRSEVIVNEIQDAVNQNIEEEIQHEFDYQVELYHQ